MSVSSGRGFPRVPDMPCCWRLQRRWRSRSGRGRRYGSDGQRPELSTSAPGASTSTARDLKVNPGDDFERYASGTWMDATEIPADKSSNSVGSEVNDRNQERLQTIVTGSPKDSQLGALLRQLHGRGAARAARRGAAEGRPRPGRRDQEQGRVRQLHGRDASATMARPCSAPASVPDPVNPAINTLYLGTSGLGLPDRDYYLLDKYKPQRDAYRAYIAAHAAADRRCRCGGRRRTGSWRSRPTSPSCRWPSRRPARHRQGQQPDDAGAAGRPMRRASTGRAYLGDAKDRRCRR